MKNCCNHTSTDTQCTRKSDGKVFDLPRKYSRKRCRNPKGFTMKSSCAPYKDCYKNKHKHKNKTRKQKTIKKQRGSGNKTRRRRDNTRKITRKTRKRKQTAGAETSASSSQQPSSAPEPRLSWEKMLPELAARTINPLDCIAAQWLILKTKLSDDVESLLKETIKSIEQTLNDELGENGIDQYIQSDDFYTKWAVGGVGHASAVILSDLLSFLPGAGTVGMIHQLATDKGGPAVAKSEWYQTLKGKLTKQFTKYETLIEKLTEIKDDWLESLPPTQKTKYEHVKFLESIKPTPPPRPSVPPDQTQTQTQQ